MTLDTPHPPPRSDPNDSPMTRLQLHAEALALRVVLFERGERLDLGGKRGVGGIG